MSPRLLKIANMVRHSTLVDIGTDHAHLPIYLAQGGRVCNVLATDIALEPLERGRQNAAYADVLHIVDFKQGAGLEGVTPLKYETCTISGMGGEMIAGILQNSPDVAKGFKQLVLSPQRSVPKLRRFLHDNGFSINNEEIVEDNGKFYNILDCSPNPQEPYDDAGYEFGQILLEGRHPLLGSLIRYDMKKYENINMDALPGERRAELEKYIKLCLEVLEWL
ncbi:MAG: class I SAM-dependent methyltransferase [Defluviitaleaceae bacterium]|nr:class I SAM-dependent methyltransferase [Defluviitaleaceae bacterium]